jgi:hypothetical protein
MPPTTVQLTSESSRATELLQGKVVARVIRHRETEVLVEFTDQSRLFIDRSHSGVELSITERAGSTHALTTQQAYLATFAFLETQFRSTGSEELGALLGSLALLPDGSPADPAHKREWEAAVASSIAGDVDAKLGP